MKPHDIDLIIYWTIFALVIIALALPPALSKKSWKRFFLSLFLLIVGVLFPLFIFGMSIALIPRWKGACRYGLLDCFHMGKLALTPLVLWASAAFYTAQILMPKPKLRVWVDLGLFVGAVTSTVCLVIGLIIHIPYQLAWWLLVPFGVSIWYTVLSVRTIRKFELGYIPYLITLIGSIPFWIASIFLSKKHYLSLPDNPPTCFVVTAALRGHEEVVGPFLSFEKSGVSRVVNAQLKTFWQFEALWMLYSPRTHAAFRRFYNWLGPRIASHVNSQFTADVLYLLLKPLEALAAFLIHLEARKKR